MLLPISLPGMSQPPSGSSGNTGGGTEQVDGSSGTDTGTDGGTPPVEETSGTDTGNETNTGNPSGGSGGTAGSDGDDTQSPPPRPANGSVDAAPVPYVAPPTMTPSKVAEFQSSAETRAKLEAAFSADVDEARARRFAEAAQERAANEALIASIVPPPENSPSLLAGVEDLRAEQPARAEREPAEAD